MANLLRRRLVDAALRHRVAICLGLGLLLYLPTLSTGFYIDDYWHQALLDARARGLERSTTLDFCLKLWSLDAGLPGRSYLQAGSPYALPWFLDPGLRLRFFRPVTAWTLLMNYRLLGTSPFGYHAVNLALWLALVAAVLELHRRLLPDTASRPALLLAGLFFVLDDAHVYDVAWIASRHELLDVLLALVSLLAYDRYRHFGGLRRFLLSLAALVLALGAGETAVLTLVWLAAYEVFLARDPVRDRIASAAPFAALVLGYVAFYLAAGYGTAASSWYLNPFDRPLDYLRAAFTNRIPGYVMGALTLIPAELAQTSSALVILGGLALVLIVVLVLAPSLRLRPEMRFTAAAAVGSLPLLSIVPPFSYKLLFPSAAVSFLLGVAVTDTVRRLRAVPRSRMRALGLWGAVGLVVLMHGLGSPVLASTLLRDFAHNTRLETRQAFWRTVEWPQDRERSEVYLIETPGTWTGLFLPSEDFYFTGEWVGSYVPVSFHAVDLEITRLDASAVLLRSEEGLLSGYFPQALAALLRPDPRLRPGEDFHRAGFTVAVDATRAGVPTRLLVRFPRNLDDPRVWLLAFDGTRTRRVRPPRIGETQVLQVRQP